MGGAGPFEGGNQLNTKIAVPSGAGPFGELNTKTAVLSRTGCPLRAELNTKIAVLSRAGFKYTVTAISNVVLFHLGNKCSNMGGVGHAYLL